VVQGWFTSTGKKEVKHEAQEFIWVVEGGSTVGWEASFTVPDGSHESTTMALRMERLPRLTRRMAATKHTLLRARSLAALNLNPNHSPMKVATSRMLIDATYDQNNSHALSIWSPASDSIMSCRLGILRWPRLVILKLKEDHRSLEALTTQQDKLMRKMKVLCILNQNINYFTSILIISYYKDSLFEHVNKACKKAVEVKLPIIAFRFVLYD
jgi:hypothetical protein